MDPDYKDIIAFHGHSCPGLAIGYRMSQAALAFLADKRAADEELVAIVENDACGVDALQCLTGCTFGKGNLLFRDYGKQVYTLYSRKSGNGVRVVFNESALPGGARDNRAVFIDWLLQAPDDKIVLFSEVRIEEPEQAKIRKSVSCAFCNEKVMETRTQQINNQTACLPCAARHQTP